MLCKVILPIFLSKRNWNIQTFAKSKKQSCKLSKSVNASFNNYKKASVMQISQLVNQTDRHCNKSVIQLLIWHPLTHQSCHKQYVKMP